MSEHHHHAHHSSGGTFQLLTALLMTIVMMVIEFIGGFMSGSLALISDAGHMLTDAGALFLSLSASIFARQPSTHKRTFGFYRLEILSALLNGIILVALSGYVFFEAYQRFFNPTPVKGMLMLIVAIAGLVINLVTAVILSSGGSKSLNVKGALFHVLSDALSSVGVILGGIVIIFTRFYMIDPLLGCLIGLLILRGGWHLIGESVEILLEAAPSDIDVRELAKNIKKKIAGVKDIHDVHVWTITSGLRAMSAHVLVDDRKVSRCGEISRKIKEMLEKRYSITHATLEFECENCDEGVVCELKH